jgi:uncharacterized membrane protein
MTRAERVKWLFRLLILCLFVGFILPSPLISGRLGWVDDMRVVSAVGGIIGSIITFLVLLCVITDEDEKTDEKEKEETVG